MKRMYDHSHLVHSDLSAFNLLWHEGRVHFIDVSQSVEPTHPHGLEFLLRDCTNISTFFRKKGMEGVMSPRQLFCDITGLSIAVDNDEELLVQVRQSLLHPLPCAWQHRSSSPLPCRPRASRRSGQ